MTPKESTFLALYSVVRFETYMESMRKLRKKLLLKAFSATIDIVSRLKFYLIDCVKYTLITNMGDII